MKKLLLIFCLFCVLPTTAFGARLYFEPDGVTASPGEPFVISVLLDNGGQSINAVEGDLNFSSEQLELKAIKDKLESFKSKVLRK